MSKSLLPGKMYKRKDDDSIIKISGAYDSGYSFHYLDEEGVIIGSDIMLSSEASSYELYSPVIKLNKDKELFELAFSIVANQDFYWESSGGDVSYMRSHKNLFRDLWNAKIGTDGDYKDFNSALVGVVYRNRTLTEDERDEIESSEFFDWAFANLINLKEIFSKSPLFKEGNDVPEN